MNSQDRLWPACDGPEALERIEATPLTERGLPESTYALVTRAAELWPEEPAVSFFPEAKRWAEISTRTFSELAADVHRVAHVLAELGIDRRGAVAMVAVNCEELLTTLLAAEAVGIAAPINPGLSLEHAAQIVQLAGASIIVAAGPELDPPGWEFARRLAEATGARALLALGPVLPAGPPAPLEPLDGVEVAQLAELAASAPSGGLPGPPPGASDLASFLHTGGTTGTPKLAARTHGNEVSNAWMVAASSDLDPGTAVFAALPLFHTNALIVTLLSPLLRGRHVVWAGPLGYRDLPLYANFWKIVERYRVAAMSGVPTVYAVLAQVPVDADISSLKYPIVGAAPLPAALAQRFRSHTGLDLCEGYGLTEGTCATSRNFPDAVRAGSVGQRFPYQQVRAVRIDEVTGIWEPLPAGEVGTLTVAGPNVFAGYLVPGPDGPIPDPGDALRDGWLDTGDLGSVDEEGYLRLAGRAKDLIIRGGHNIDPTTIEDVLLEHGAVTAAAAVGAPDAHSGEVPVAYVTIDPATAVDAEELRAWATERVPERAAAPRQVHIVSEIPLTVIGKPYKPELRRRATEDAARKALPDGAGVTATLDGGTVVVTISGTTQTEAAERLAPFSFAWRMS